MKKCLLCTVCSWIVGLSALVFSAMGLGGWALPSGGAVNLIYAVLGIIALGFLYYQIVPCKRCLLANRQKDITKDDVSDSEVTE